jgi:protein-tyrosine phosphatase
LTTIEGPPLRILSVCTHNRTRSVMMAALLESFLRERLGADRVQVRSGGFGPEGLPAIADAVEAMRRRGLDVSGHRSRPVTVDDLTDVDVVLTAERNHVVRVAALSPQVFGRAMTLPEFLDRAHAGERDVDDPSGWIPLLTADRTASAYLSSATPEIVDPTGSASRAFDAAVERLEQQCREASQLLVGGRWAR